MGFTRVRSSARLRHSPLPFSREGRKISDDIFKPAYSLGPNRLMCLKTLAKTPFSPRNDSPLYFLPPSPTLVFLSSSNHYVTPLLAVGDYAAICANPLLHDIKWWRSRFRQGGKGGCYWGDFAEGKVLLSAVSHGRSRRGRTRAARWRRR